MNTVLSSLERCPEEYVTDPWVAERVTLVTEERGRIAAAAHLLRYRDDPYVGEDYRGTGHLAWILHHPADDTAPDTRTEPTRAAELLMSACLAQFGRWESRSRFCDGRLPVPGVYGIPEQWPHVRGLLERAGFVHTGTMEVLLLATVDALPAPGAAPLPGLIVRRTLGVLGTRFTALLDGQEVARLEVDTILERPERHARPGCTADLADLALSCGADPLSLVWLLGEVRGWLVLSGVDRLFAYSDETPDGAGERAMLSDLGFQEMTRTARAWEHRPA
ncbi:N-acetyltransferase [Streptomyces sp. NPDC088729]|uniref:N-acetyltransferase n=1 Tax=Streptomyces sp. NPDC088729 TaxID=3365876 RepID=UPI00381AED83